MILLFVPWRPDDDALEVTRWVASRTREVLGVEQTIVVEGETACREELERALSEEDPRGVALFGHGNQVEVLGTDRKSALDADNVAMLKGRWGYALACRAGVELAGLAAAAGATVFVGYNSIILVEWNPNALPPALRPHVIELVTTVPKHLNDGVHAEVELKRAISQAADELIEALDDHPIEEGTLFLEVLAQQLVDRLEVRPHDVSA